MTADDDVRGGHGRIGRGDGEGHAPSPEDAVALSPIKVGMLAFLASEAAFFGTLIDGLSLFLAPDHPRGRRIPSQVFRLPMVLAASACLFSSSATIHVAEKALRRNARRAFLGWWGLTIVLGVLFLLGTMLEWNELICRWGLTISRNLFGTTYFTLVGFHALARDHWRDRDEHRVRPGAGGGRSRSGTGPAWRSSPGTGTSWMVSGRWSLPWCMWWDAGSE